MVQRLPDSYTEKQMNYALKKFAGDGNSMEIARSVGYSPAVAKSPKQKIESKGGYKNAMIEILKKSDKDRKSTRLNSSH